MSVSVRVVWELILDMWTDYDETLSECSLWTQKVTETFWSGSGRERIFFTNFLVKGHLAKALKLGNHVDQF